MRYFIFVEREVQYLCGIVAQELCFVFFLRAATDHCNRLSFIESAIAGCAIADAAAKIFFFAQIWLAIDDTRRKDDAGSFIRILCALQHKGRAHAVDSRNLIFRNGDAHGSRMIQEALCHFRARNFRQAKVVQHRMCLLNLYA